MVVHSRRGVGDVLSQEEATDRRAFVASPDGKLLLAGVTRRGRYTSLLDAETGETLFSGEIYQFSPQGTFFIAGNPDAAYGIWRSDNRKLVCELAPKGIGLYIDSSTLRLTRDERTAFCSRMGEESSNLTVFDLETGEQISERVVRNPFLRIRDVYPGSTFLLTNRANGPGHHFFNWRTGQFEHHLDPGCQLPEISPNDETVAYVRSDPSDDGITPDAITLVIEELPSHRALRAIELPCMPRELRFVADGQTVMAILELTARQHHRTVALLYGIQPSDMDGETISWTPCSY
jgi:hypothetical protein